MMNIKGTVLLGVVALSVVLTAATSAESNKKPDLPMDTIRAQQNQETVLNEAKDGLEFTVTLNKARFTLQDEILAFCETPRTRRELEEHFSQYTLPYLMQRFVNPLVEKGLLCLSLPQKPKSKNQRFQTILR
jgi:ATP-dependent DNA helicase RecG